MAHGLNSVLKRGPATISCKNEGKTGVGSRRIFAPHFKLQVLDSYRNDDDCKGNQRATARKYGIHRRQIQKWLQVENNLRISVCKGKNEGLVSRENNNESRNGVEMALKITGHRQRDDFALYDVNESSNNSIPTELRVPALSPHNTSYNIVAPVPLDFTTHSRVGHPSPIVCRSATSPLTSVNPEAPIDLSFKKYTAALIVASGEPSPHAPVSCFLSSQLRSSTPTSLVQPHPDVWDLSTKRKLEDDNESCVNFSPTVERGESSAEAPKPIKLFKPYLDDVKQDSLSNASNNNNNENKPACCSSSVFTPPRLNSDFYYYNHNNNICEIKAECTYTIQELHTKGSLSYFPFSNNYNQSTEYEPVTYCCGSNYDETSYASGLIPLKQRHSYSLDFKLSAIECYYEDTICKGNQRAVANKYNIHRRQVQTWLKQEEELRQRNESLKQTHAIR